MAPGTKAKAKAKVILSQYKNRKQNNSFASLFLGEMSEDHFNETELSGVKIISLFLCIASVMICKEEELEDVN